MPGIRLATGTTRNQLFGKVRSVSSLKSPEIQRMYQLMQGTYDNVSEEQFHADLNAKDDVILLYEIKTKTLQGFSTLKNVQLSCSDRVVEGIFSGDTVISKHFWGGNALGKTFLKYLWLKKMRSPHKPLYWFLISKGYKTYLLMANNFSTHYPRYERPTPALVQEIIDTFYKKKYPAFYNMETGLVVPKGPSCSVKENLAQISDSLLMNPRIDFFVRKNPNWNCGVELACIAEMTLLMPLYYSIKKFFKGLK